MRNPSDHSTVYFLPGSKAIFNSAFRMGWGWCACLSLYFFSILALRLKDEVLSLPQHERLRASASIIHSILVFAAGKSKAARRIADRVSEDPLSLATKGAARKHITPIFEQEVSAFLKKQAREESLQEA